jgi:hypothetical protein
MKRYVCVALTNAAAGEDDEFNRWYDDVHLADVLRIPGFVRARRYRLAATDPPQRKSTHQYLAVYEVETDDIDATRRALFAAAGTSAMVLSGSMADPLALFFELIHDTSD